MPKRPLQDIVPKPSVPRRVVSADSDAVDIRQQQDTRMPQDISPRRPLKSTQDSDVDSDEDVYVRTPVRNNQDARFFGASKKRRFPWLPIAGGVVFALVVVGVFLSTVFAGAVVTVHPRHQEVTIDKNFIATQDDVPGQLAFKTTSIDKTASKEVPATKAEQVEERASGKITIYNNFDTAPQRLIKNTRFESKEGKIFRIGDSVTVPGKNKDTATDGTTSPGSIEVVVYADEPGEAYNIPPSDFKIPGFEGTDRYNGFSATSKEPMTGGFKGTRNTLDESALADIQSQLGTQVKADLIAQAKTAGQVPEGMYSFDGAYFYESESLPIENVGNNVKIQVKGTLHNVLFDAKQFAAHLATAVIAGYDNTDIAIENPEDLKVTVTPIDKDLETEIPWQNKSLQIDVKGSGKFVWQYDEEQLKKDLAGKEKIALQTILSGYTSIEKADVALRPFWKATFPQNVEKIKIVRKLD